MSLGVSFSNLVYGVAASLASLLIQLFRFNTAFMVLLHGKHDLPSSDNIRLNLTAPIVGCFFRISNINFSVSVSVFSGVLNGARLRFDILSPDKYRAIHLSPIGRLIPYSRHSAALLFSFASTSFTNSSRLSSTVFSSQDTSIASFSSISCLYFIKKQ